MSPRVAALAIIATLILVGDPLSAAVPPPGAPWQASAVLRSMLAAPGLIDYEGTKVITTRRGDRVETVTVLDAHKRPNQTRLEFLSPEALVGRVVVDNGAETWHYEPSLHMAFQGPTLSRPGGVTETLRAVLATARVDLAGTEEVIGRPAFVLVLSLRGGGRRLLWVDQATGVPLRVEERAGDEAVYAAYFTRISFSLNLPETLFRFRAPAGARIFSLFPSEEDALTVEQVQRSVRFALRMPAALPAGVRFERAGVVRYGPVGAAVLRYTAGGAPLSVFQVPRRQMPQAARAPAGEVLTLASVPARLVEFGYFRMVTWSDGSLLITIVGAQPRSVLLALAAQFVRR